MCTAHENAAETPTKNKRVQEFSHLNKKSKRAKTIFLFLVTILVTILTIFIVTKPNNLNNVSSIEENTNYRIKLVGLDDTQELLPNTFEAIDDYEDERISVLATQGLFDSPFITWQQHHQTTQDLLLAYRTYKINYQGKDQIVLRFHIQGKERGWQGYIVEDSIKDIDLHFSNFISRITTIDYFVVETERAVLAQLSLLHTKYPKEPLLALQLAKAYFDIEAFSILSALIEQSTKSNNHPLYQGLFDFIKVEMFGREQKRSDARKAISQAIEHFSALNLPQLISLAQIDAAFAFLTVDASKSHELLTKSINNARIANEPLLEMQGHLVQAFIASKQEELTLMQVGFAQATELFELNHFQQHHFANILHYQASAAKMIEDQLNYNLQLLQQPYSKQYSNYFYEATTFIQEYYLSNNVLEKLALTIKPWQNETFALLTKAKIAHAQGQKELAVNLAIEAFNGAQIRYEKYYALDAALLLITFNQEAKLELDDQVYVEYINKNGTNRWRRMNRKKLIYVGYWQ